MASTMVGATWMRTSWPCSYSVTPKLDKSSRPANSQGQGPRTYQNKYAMHSLMANALPHVKLAALTSAASAIRWTMVPSLALRPIRMVAG